MDGDRTLSYWSVQAKGEIALIIDFFTRYPLLTCKYLDFLAFKEAFEIASKSPIYSLIPPADVIHIRDLKVSMNTLRSNTDYIIQRPINTMWLLGFIEGDGSFNITQANLKCAFEITQKKISTSLMQLIVDYFNDLFKPVKPFNLQAGGPKMGDPQGP
jgi:hypothetical protein